MTTATAAPVLRAEGLTVSYGSGEAARDAVVGVDLEIREGEILGVVGGSGSGKSSLAFGLLGLARGSGRVSAGKIWFGDHDLLADEDAFASLRGREIALIVQSPRSALNPMLTIGRQICDVYRAHTGGKKDEAREKAIESLRLVGINDPARRFNAYPHELSGGMAQRAVIAMALVLRPRVLVADEPTSGLDVTIQAQILDDLADSCQKTGSAVLLITQSLSIVANYAGRILIMDDGKIVEEASQEAFFSGPSHPRSRELLRSMQAGVGVRS